MSTSGHRWHDGQVVAVLDGRGQAVQVTDVLVVQVDVEEPLNLPVVEDSSAEGGILGGDVLQHRADGAAAGLELGLAAGVLPHGGGDLNLDGHEFSFFASYFARMTSKMISG